ncbi:MAG: hypothetical protein FWG12_01790 [Holophagaceae bacterium]|nr:hypothetical protein [Holophagaceae bacterium]
MREPIQWMTTIDDQKILLVPGSLDNEGNHTVEIFFNNGESFAVPLPRILRTELIHPHCMLTECGVELITKRVTTTFVPNEDIEKRPLLQFYSISFDEIKKGKFEWELKRQGRVSNVNFQIVPIGDKYHLGCLSDWNNGISSSNAQRYDWIVYTRNDNSNFVEHDFGGWLSQDSSSYHNDPVARRYDSIHKYLTLDANSAVVHTKTFLAICNRMTGNMLVFSKETGKLARRLKLTEAVPLRQNSEFVAAVPITIVQPDLDDGLIVLARTDRDILESISEIEKMKKFEKLFKDGDSRDEIEFMIDNSRELRQDAQWYRVNLKNGKIDKITSPDLPSTWDHDRWPPVFIPYLYDQFLFGGVEKGYGQLIEPVFKKPPERLGNAAPEIRLETSVQIAK